MVDGCMRAPRALHRPTARPHAHPRATMRTAAACSTCAWACPRLPLVATFAATWPVARADAWRNQILRSRCECAGIPCESSVKAIGRC